MADLQIDVDNLCSFMAQDKVGQFTTQNAKGMLEMTLKSISSDDVMGRTLHDVQVSLTYKILYAVGNLVHVEWCIRYTARVFFYHTL